MQATNRKGVGVDDMSRARRNDRAVQIESGIDWAEKWRADEMHSTLTEEDLHFISDRARRFKTAAQPSGYAREFLDRADIRPGESVLDMGCGGGTLALPLAIGGHHVVACDYSTAMLRRLEQFADLAGVGENVEVERVSWTDSWDGLPVADVFIASRTLRTRDLAQTVRNIEAHTRRRCFVSVPTYLSPHHDLVMLNAIGRSDAIAGEDVYLVNLLMQWGRLPELSYIRRSYPSLGESLDEARDSYEREDGPFTPEESQKLDAFIADNYKVATDSLGGSILHRSYPREVVWAFVAWDVPPKE